MRHDSVRSPAPAEHGSAGLAARLELPLAVLRWLTRRREILDVFVYRPGRELRREPGFLTFEKGRTPPADLKRQLRRLHGSRILFPFVMRRLRTGQGVLTCAVEDGHIVGFGWFLRWNHFRRKFGWLTPEGRMAAFHWIDPSVRGQGLMGRLMTHGMASIDGIGTYPLVAHTAPGNTASQRGLEKMDFLRLGRYEIVQWFAGLFVRVTVLEHERDLADVHSVAPRTETQ